MSQVGFGTATDPLQRHGGLCVVADCPEFATKVRQGPGGETAVFFRYCGNHIMLAELFHARRKECPK